MRLSGALTLIGAATVGMVGTAGEETSRELWRNKRGQNGHGTHGDGDHHDDGPRGKVYRRVMVKEGHPETVLKHGPIRIKAKCEKEAVNSRALQGTAEAIDLFGEPEPAETHLEASLELIVKPREEDCKNDDDVTEHILTSFSDGEQTATRDYPFSCPVWNATHHDGFSVATASGHYVGFDGDRVLSMVGGEGAFYDDVCGNGQYMDSGFEGCVIIMTLEVHGGGREIGRCFDDDDDGRGGRGGRKLSESGDSDGTGDGVVDDVVEGDAVVGDDKPQA